MVAQMARCSVVQLSPVRAQAILCQGDAILDVKLLALRDAYQVKVGDLEPWCPSVCAPEAYQKWMILDPRAKVSGAQKKRKGVLREDDEDVSNDNPGPGSAGRKVEPHDTVPLTFWSPGQDMYRELIHRFNAGIVFDLTAVDNVSALASVPYGLAWTAIAQTAAHAAHLRARVAAGLLHAMLDRTSPLFSPELACACRSIAAEIPGIMPQEKTDKENTPQTNFLTPTTFAKIFASLAWLAPASMLKAPTRSNALETCQR